MPCERPGLYGSRPAGALRQPPVSLAGNLTQTALFRLRRMMSGQTCPAYAGLRQVPDIMSARAD